jgi:uncharacterized protein (DUF2147 family)
LYSPLCLWELDELLSRFYMPLPYWNGEKYAGANILDPESGKEYQCQMWLEGNSRLIVRGFIGFSMIGRSQVWERIK